MDDIQRMAQDDSIVWCAGCRKTINGRTFLHVGCHLSAKDEHIQALQTPDDVVPALALLHPLGTGDLVLVPGRGFDVELLEEQLVAIQAKYAGEAISTLIMVDMFHTLREYLKRAVANGDIVRDYLGKWHAIGNP